VTTARSCIGDVGYRSGHEEADTGDEEKLRRPARHDGLAPGVRVTTGSVRGVIERVTTGSGGDAAVH
jgi:hypothetical protein